MISASTQRGGGEVLTSLTPAVLEQTYDQGYSVMRSVLPTERLRGFESCFWYGPTKDVELETGESFPPGANYAFRSRLRAHSAVTAIAFPALSSLMEETRSALQAAGAAIGDDSTARWGGEGLMPATYRGAFRRRPKSPQLLASQSNVIPEGCQIALHNDREFFIDVTVLYSIAGTARYSLHPGRASKVQKDRDFPRFTEELEAGDGLVLATNPRTRKNATRLMAHRVTNIGRGPRKSIGITSKSFAD